jgi:hypothetical protein
MYQNGSQEGGGCGSSLVVLIVLVILVAFGINQCTHSQTPTTTVTENSVTASEQASRVNNLLQASKASRSSVKVAYDDVNSCQNLPGDATIFSDAVSQRKQQLAEVATLQTSALPQGAEMKSQLTKAIQSSLQADHAFLIWAQQSEHNCPGQAPHTAAYHSAMAASTDATTYKRGFLGTWNAIAAQEGLPTETQADI